MFLKLSLYFLALHIILKCICTLKPNHSLGLYIQLMQSVSKQSNLMKPPFPSNLNNIYYHTISQKPYKWNYHLSSLFACKYMAYAIRHINKYIAFLLNEGTQSVYGVIWENSNSGHFLISYMIWLVYNLYNRVVSSVKPRRMLVDDHI